MLSAMKPNSNHVISMLTYLLKAGEKLTLLIPYKALLLTQEVRTIEIGDDYMILQAPNQRLCSSITEKIYLYIERSPQGLAARVLEMNLPRGIITLSGFRFMDSPWSERRSDRVEPGKTTHLLLRSTEFSHKGRLVDLSLHGLGVLVSSREEKPIPIKAGDKLKAEITLESDIPSIKLDTEVVSSRIISQTLTRLGLFMSPKGIQKTLLAQYVASRRNDILSELENVSSHVMDPRGSKDLYF